MKHTTMDAMLDRYDGFLFDAFGVLVQGDRALPGAVQLIDHLHKNHIDYVVITNDATRGLQTSVDRFEHLGMSIAKQRIITSGSLMTRAVNEHDLHGAKAIVLGPEDTQAYAVEANLELVDPMTTTLDQLDVLIVGDYPQTNTLPHLEAAVSTLLRSIDGGHIPKLLLPNPDLIYPKSKGHFGLTAGSIAKMIEHILHERYPDKAKTLCFEGLGKPHKMIYDEGLERLTVDPADVLMIGDQLATDILGATRVGLDCALITTGLITALDNTDSWPASPTYLLSSLHITPS